MVGHHNLIKVHLFFVFEGREFGYLSSSPLMCAVFFCSSLSLPISPPSSTSSQHTALLITVLVLNGFLSSQPNQCQTMTLIEAKRNYARAWGQWACISYLVVRAILLRRFAAGSQKFDSVEARKRGVFFLLAKL